MQHVTDLNVIRCGRSVDDGERIEMACAEWIDQFILKRHIRIYRNRFPGDLVNNTFDSLAA